MWSTGAGTPAHHAKQLRFVHHCFHGAVARDRRPTWSLPLQVRTNRGRIGHRAYWLLGNQAQHRSTKVGNVGALHTLAQWIGLVTSRIGAQVRRPTQVTPRGRQMHPTAGL